MTRINMLKTKVYRATAFATLLTAILTLDPVPHTAQAQNLSIGNTDRLVAETLRRNGYTETRVTRRGLTIIRAQACRDGKKYLVKVSILGKITSSQEIGSCAVAQAPRPAPQPAPVFGAQQAIQFLRDQGLTDVSAESVPGGGAVALGCTGGRYTELTFNRQGSISNRRPLRLCDNGRAVAERPAVRPAPQQQASLSTQELRAALRRQGYRRIEITDGEAPRYGAEACNGEERVRLTMNQRGNVRRERTIGQCRQPVNVADLPAKLSAAGYDRIRLLRRDRPPYLAEACKGANLMELTINRFGETRKEDRVGRCAVPVTKETLTTNLAKAGYFNIEVSKTNDRWVATYCNEESRTQSTYDRYGEAGSSRVTGACTSATVLNVLKNLENRGATKTSIAVTGCFKNTEYRWIFDRLGNRTGRERTGRGC